MMNIQALTKMSYGVYAVSTWAGEGRATGCTANSAMQVTAEPATIAVSINHDNFTNECIKARKRFAVNILGENSDPMIIGSFGFKSGRDCSKFDKHEPIIKDYLPVVKGSIAYITCTVIDSFETSTHTIFIGEVADADIINADDEPMTYSYYHKVIKGKAPKNAPTYIKD